MIRQIYNRTVRLLALKFVGPRLANFSGVKARYPAITDLTRSFNHKAQMIDHIQKTVKDGDQVIEVGSGRGVLTVHAARQGATVTGYEGSASMIATARDTVSINGVDDRVELIHGIVGEAMDVYGESGDVANVNPGNLPEADILILDCEGSELSIIPQLNYRPRAIIVETHPGFGATTERVTDELRERGLGIMDIAQMNDRGHDAVLAQTE